MGDDRFYLVRDIPYKLFLSTSPVWGTTGYGAHAEVSGKISIHVPRMGDDCQQLHDDQQCHISIHVPRMGDDASDSGEGCGD